MIVEFGKINDQMGRWQEQVCGEYTFVGYCVDSSKSMWNTNWLSKLSAVLETSMNANDARMFTVSNTQFVLILGQSQTVGNAEIAFIRVDQVSVSWEFQYSVVAVSVRHEKNAVGSYCHVGRFAEMMVVFSRYECFAQN